MSPLVGRDEEIDLLLRRWARAKDGDGQVMLVSGESGIGKSRITAELAKRLRTEPHLRPRYFGLSTSSVRRHQRGHHLAEIPLARSRPSRA